VTDANGNFANIAIAGGNDSSGNPVSDPSDDPTDPTDDDPNADNNPDDPTVFGTSQISVTKQVVGTAAAASGTSGNYDVTYEFVVSNTGSSNLSSITLTEDFASQFGGAFLNLVSAPSITSSSATDSPGINANYNGASDANVFDGSSSLLQVGQQVVVTLTVEVDPDSPGAIYDAVTGNGGNDLENQASTSGITPGGDLIEDASDDPTDPTNVDGDPSDPANTTDDDGDPDDPTSLLLPDLSVIKELVAGPLPTSSGTVGNLEATYELTLINTGNESLSQVSLIEDMASQFGGAFAGVVGTPTIVNLTAIDAVELNAAFDGGLTDADLFDSNAPNTNLLRTGEFVTVRFTAEVDPDNPTAIYSNGLLVNSATGVAVGVSGGGTLSDISDDPTDPSNSDPDGDGEPDDPTVLTTGSQVAGSVYIDSNGNGVRDPGEPGIIGVEIILTGTDINGNPIDVSVFSDADGNYVFEDILPGDYTLTQVHPQQFVDGPEQLGTLGGTQGNDTFSFTLTAGSTAGQDYNFAELGVASQFVNKGFLLSSTPDTYWQNLNASGSGVLGLWVPFEATRGGAVDAILIDAEDIEVDLFDENMRPLNPARIGEDGGTWVVREGEQYFVRLRGDDPRFDLDLGLGDEVDLNIEELRVQDNVVVAVATGGDDQVELVLGEETHLLTMGEYRFEFDATEIDTFHLGGSNGVNDVRVVGTYLDDTASVLDKRGELVSDAYSVYTYSFDNTTFEGGGGYDYTQIYGSTGSDTLQGLPQDSTLTTPDSMMHMLGFERVDSYGRGGDDYASMYGTDGNDTYYTFDTYEVLTGGNMSMRTIGWDRVDAFGRGGIDTTRLYDTPDDDHFWSFDNYAVMVSDHLYAVVKGFEDTIAEANKGGNDTLHIRDLSVNEDLNTTDGTTTLSGRNRTVEATGFETEDFPDSPTTLENEVGVSIIHNDVRYFSQIADDGELFFASHSGSLLDPNVSVDVDGSMGIVVGTSGDDSVEVLLGSDTHLVLTGGYSIEFDADVIDDVRLGGSTGVNSISITSTDANDAVRVIDARTELTSSRYALTAFSFDNVTLSGGAGNDSVELFGSSGDDVLASLPQQSTLTMPTGTVDARGFERVDVYGRGGNDTASLFGSLNNDVFWRFANYEVMTAANMQHTTKGFERVEAYGRSGNDMAHVFDTAGDDQFFDFAAYAVMLSADSRIVTKGFEETNVESKAGGNDVAHIRELTAVEHIFARQEEAVISGSLRRTNLDGFDSVLAQLQDDANAPSTDLADLDFVFGKDWE